MEEEDESLGEDATAPVELTEIVQMAGAGASPTHLKERAAALGVLFSEEPARRNLGALSPMVADLVRSTPAGTLSKIGRTERGWHLLQVLRYRPEHEPTLEEVEERIRMALAAEKQEELRLQILGAMECSDPEADDAIKLLHFAREIYGPHPEAVDEIATILHNHLLAAKELESLFGAVEVTDDEVRAEYEHNPERYVPGRQFSVLQAEVPRPGRSEFETDREYDLAVAERRRALIEWTQELQEAGTSFRDLQLGDSPFPIRVTDRGTAPTGPRGFLLDRSVANLEVGGFSTPHATGELFTIFELAAVEDISQVHFDEVRAQVKMRLLAERREQRLGEIVCDALKEGRLPEQVVPSGGQLRQW